MLGVDGIGDRRAGQIGLYGRLAAMTVRMYKFVGIWGIMDGVSPLEMG